MSYIGKRGYAKKLGPLVLGTIEHEVCGLCYSLIINQKEYFKQWDICYPDWKKHKVLYVKLDKPSKSTTLEELVQGNKLHNLGYDEEELINVYVNMPEVSYLRFPEQDFEVLTD